ncbi:hypothetical protein BGHDH14_bgh01614 [Blumeria hordei DH14]|uniref:Uncharacterized protein n=1 Tax=Blumeria graminis f. sp. hordei (strain DH14) TaxID=546991 RepID=N1JN96_BLUG1|nr:hypothetical protein BGHDH14_bgh01614 [Blumeria hordei DH14]
MAKKTGKKAKATKGAKAEKAAKVEPSHTGIGSEDLQDHHTEVPLQSLQSNINVPISESQQKDLPCDLPSKVLKSEENFNSITPDHVSSSNAENQTKITDHENGLKLKEQSPFAEDGIETEITVRQEMCTEDRDTLQNAPNIMINEGSATFGVQIELSTSSSKPEDLHFERVTSEFSDLESVKDMNTEAHNINHSVNLSHQSTGLSAVSHRVSPNISEGNIENLMAETASIFPPDEDHLSSTSHSTDVKGLPADDINEFIQVSTSNNEASHPIKSQTSEDIPLEAQNIEMLESANNLDEATMKDIHKSSHLFQEVNHIPGSNVKLEDGRKHNENSSPEPTAPEIDTQIYTCPSTGILKTENLPTLSKDFSTGIMNCTYNLAETVSQATWTEFKETAKMGTNQAESQADNNHASGDLFADRDRSIKETAVGNESNLISHSSKSNMTDQGNEEMEKNQEYKEIPVGNTVKISPDAPSLRSDHAMNAWDLDTISNRIMGTGLDELIPQEKPNTKDDNKSSIGPDELRPKINSKISHTSHSLQPYVDKDDSNSATCRSNSFVVDDESTNSRMSTTAHRAEDDVLGDKYTGIKNFEQATSCVTEETKLVPSVNGAGIIEDITREVSKAPEAVEETSFKNLAADENNCNSNQIETGLGTMVSSIIQVENASNESTKEPKDADYERHNPKGVVSSGPTKSLEGNSIQIDVALHQNKVPTTLSCSVSKDQMPKSSLKETTTILTESKIQVVEQAPDMELVTMSKQSLDLLHQSEYPHFFNTWLTLGRAQ